MKKQLGLLIVIVALSAVQSVAQAGICESFFTKRAEKKAVKLQTAKDQLERVVEAELIKAGFTIKDDPAQSFLINRRIKKLAAKMNPCQFRNLNYRQYWIEKLIDLKIKEQIGPVREGDVIWSEVRRKDLNRIILRTLIAKGVADLPEASEKPGAWQRFMRVARSVHHNKPFRLLVEWRLPRENIQLTEEQILAIADRGAEAIDADPVLLKAISGETRQNKIQLRNTMVVTVMSLFYMSIYTNLAIDEYNRQMQVEEQKAIENGEKYEEEVIETTSSIETEVEDIKLDLAKNEIEIIEVNILANYDAPITLDEKKQIRNKICIEKYGEILSVEDAQQCLAFEM